MADLSTCFDPNYQLRKVTHDAGSYYLRQGEAPGRWTGSGAQLLGLAGEVTGSDLHALFSGKEPRTGRWLTDARGSSARVARRAGDEHLDVRAAAVRFDLSEDTVRRRLRSGALAGEKAPSGQWRIPGSAVDAYRAGDPQPQSPGGLPALGVDGRYGIDQAARLAGVNRSYLTRIARLEPPENKAGDDGKPVQYLVGMKDGRGRWRIDPVELQRFTAGRRPPRAVPAYDLVLRAPKSVAILHALGDTLPPEELALLGLSGNVAQEVLLAHHAALGDAIALLERHAAFIRGPGD